MKIPKYLDKANRPAHPLYICAKCAKQHRELSIHSNGLYLDVTCCKCGTVGMFRRLTDAAAERATETK